MQLKRLFPNFLLLCSSFVFAVLLLEILLRLLPADSRFYYQGSVWNHWGGDESNRRWYNESYVYSDVLGYEKKELNEKIKNILRNNPSSYKILILGDSITEGEEYIEYFKNLLAEKYKDSNIEVIGAGVTGYDTELEYNYLRHRGLALNPNLVILQFCSANDFAGTPVIIRQKDGSWLALDGNKKLSKWIRPDLIARSKLYEFITLRLLYFSKRSGLTQRKSYVKEPLCHIKQILKEKKIPFYFLIFPQLDESDESRRLHNMVMDIVEELYLNSNTIDLLPYFSGIDFEKIRRDPTHPNKKGNRIAANALLKELSPLLDREFNLDLSQ